MEQFKTFEQCCAAKGYDPAACLPDVSNSPFKFQEAIIAIAKLYIITEAVNEGWVPNWNEYDEYKWYPWFDMGAPGVRFLGSGYVYSLAYSAGGSRLCFKTRAISNFVAENYKDLWEKAMVLS